MKRLLLLLAGSAALIAAAAYALGHLHDGEDTSGGDT